MAKPLLYYTCTHGSLEAAGSSLKQIITQCFKLVRAEKKQEPESLSVLPSGVVNMDTSTIAGISRAKHMKLVDTNLVDALHSSYLHEASTMFTEHHQGRMITMMRHPCLVVCSLFYYQSNAYWERSYKPELKNMTILEFARPENSNLRVDNWMTRILSRKLKGDLGEERFVNHY